jgi:hypothetical protein
LVIERLAVLLNKNLPFAKPMTAASTEHKTTIHGAIVPTEPRSKNDPLKSNLIEPIVHKRAKIEIDTFCALCILMKFRN